MQFLRTHHRWSLVPALIWLMAQMMMVQVSAAPAQTLPSGANGPPFEVVICTPNGLKTIILDPQAPDTGNPAQTITGMGCKWCQAFGAGAILQPPADTWLVNSTGHLITLIGENGCTAGPRPAVAGFRSRAPPLPETAI